jgi:hypothetical protein
VARTVILVSQDTVVARLWRNRATAQASGEQSLAITNDAFSHLVLNERHYSKNSMYERHKFIRMIKRENLVLVSAAPIADSTRDMVRYTKLIRDPRYLFEKDD